MTNLFDYSQTPASNNSSPPNGAPEDQAPSTVNNVMRQMMANMAGAFKVYTAGGSANAQTVTMDPTLAAYSSKVHCFFIPVADNTGACTLNINSLGAVSIKLQDGEDPHAGAIDSNHVAYCVHNGTNFILINPVIKFSSNAESVTATATNRALTPANIPFFVPYPSVITGTIANGSDATNDIDFIAGYAIDSTETYNIVFGAMTKRADATWAAGTGNGGMASGVTWAANDFHLFVLGKTSDPTAHDFIFDTSLTCANGLADAAVVSAGFTIFQRITSLRTAAAAWPLITTSRLAGGALEVMLKTPAFEFAKDWSGGADNNAQTGTLSLVPGGIKVNAILGCAFSDTSASAISSLLITSLDQTDTAPAASTGSFLSQLRLSDAGGGQSASSCQIMVPTSTSRTFRYRGAATTVDHDAGFCLMGWVDQRV